MIEAMRKLFLADVADFKMTVKRDDTINYRHLVFGRPGSSCQQFELITWPGHLCIAGDMGTLVFQRMDDMFKFFRPESGSVDALRINPEYWAEKLQGANQSGRCLAEEFDAGLIHRQIARAIVSDFREHRHTWSKKTRAWIWDRARARIFTRVDENELMTAVRDFSCPVHMDGLDYYRFYTEGLRTHSLTHRFHWLCFAIVWGIHQYDQARYAAKCNEELRRIQKASRRAKGRLNSGKFEVAPQVENGADFGSRRLVLARKGETRLMWVPGSKYFSGRGTQVYAPGELTIFRTLNARMGDDITDNRNGPSNSSLRRLSKNTILRFAKEIDAVFGEGTAKRVSRLESTVIVEE